MAMQRGAVVIVGDRYIATGLIRSLGRRSIPVWVLGPRYCIAFYSRYATYTSSWPHDNEHQIQCLLDLAANHRLDNWVLFPTDDDGVGLIARNHSRLAIQYRLATPGWDDVEWAYDKRQTYKLAAQLGVDYPWTMYPRDRADVETLVSGFPVILKPAVKEEKNSFTYARAWRVDDRKELLARYDEARSLIDARYIMIQEFLRGGGEARFSFAALCLDGTLVASVVLRRSRQYPVEFGHFSTYVETVDQPDIEQCAERILKATRYSGLIEIEFHRDASTGKYKLMDVNPRLWGSHTVGAAAGVDFPYLQWKILSGETVSRVKGRVGVRWVRMIGDVRAALEEIKRGTLSPWSYLLSLRLPLAHAIFAIDDPLPGLVEFPLTVYRRYRAMLR